MHLTVENGPTIVMIASGRRFVKWPGTGAEKRQSPSAAGARGARRAQADARGQKLSGEMIKISALPPV